MKRILLAVIFGVASLTSITTKAQVSVNINIGSQPQWGPTGYDHVDYYYLPDLDVYYYVPTQQYVYLNNGSWVWRSSLPSRYSGFDLYNSYKVVMNTRRPYLSHQTHVQQYSKYKNYGGKQSNIKNSNDSRYANARNNRPATTVRKTTSVKTVNRNTQGKNTQTAPGRGGNSNKSTPARDTKNNSKNNGDKNNRGNERGRN